VFPGPPALVAGPSTCEGPGFCFNAIRNPASHKEFTNWGDQEAMEYLSSFSVFAGWVSESQLDSVGWSNR